MSIPDKILDQHLVILGKTGSGKSYTAKGMVENLMDEGERICIVDPTSGWHGLRSSANGKKPGYPVVIFGGLHQDFPLNATAGAALAEIIGESNINAIIDTRQLTVGERTRLFTDFAEALLRCNQGKLHLVIDEAHLFAPQGRVNDPQSGRMVNATNNLVSLGRGMGLCIIMISQRPAKLHKDSLTQAESMIAMRLIAPQDRGAVEDWIGEWADPAEGKDIIRSLPSLPTGTGWLWAPEIGVLKKMTFPKITTYDSSKAPTGKSKKVVLAKIKMTDIQEKLAAAMQRLQDNDPKFLRDKIAKLEAQLKSRVKHPVSDIPKAKYKEIHDAGFTEGFKDGFKEAAQQGVKALSSILSKSGHGNYFAPTVKDVKWKSVVTAKAAIPKPAATPPVRQAPTPKESSDVALGGGHRKILTALAQFPDTPLTKNKVAILSSYAVNSGGFNNYLAQLRSWGFIEGRGDAMKATDAGVQALGHYEPLPTGEDLRQHWLTHPNLGKAERQILRALFEQYPEPAPKDALAQQTGYSANSGGFNNALSRLRTLELITGRGSEGIVASEDLF